MSSPDLQLVRRALAGEPAALRRLTDRLACVPAVLRNSNRRRGNPLDPAELEDVQQDVLAAVWNKLGSFQARSSLETWLYGFCINELLRGIRAKRRRPHSLNDAAAEDAAASAGSATALDERDEVRYGLTKLGSPAADVIRMKHLEQLTFEEIAAHLEVSVSTVKSQYYRGLDKLRDHLSPVRRNERA